jgi:hypothetical protein
MKQIEALRKWDPSDPSSWLDEDFYIQEASATRRSFRTSGFYTNLSGNPSHRDLKNSHAFRLIVPRHFGEPQRHGTRIESAA